jgi:hypothetical protein
MLMSKHGKENDDAISTLSDQVMKLMEEVQELKTRNHNYSD